MHCKNWKTILPFAITFLVGISFSLNKIQTEKPLVQAKETNSISILNIEKLKYDQNCQDNYDGVEFDRLFKVKSIIESKIRFLEMTGKNSDELDVYLKKRDKISKYIESKIRIGNEEREAKGIICYFPGKLCDEE